MASEEFLEHATRLKQNILLIGLQLEELSGLFQSAIHIIEVDSDPASEATAGYFSDGNDRIATNLERQVKDCFTLVDKIVDLAEVADSSLEFPILPSKVA